MNTLYKRSIFVNKSIWTRPLKEERLYPTDVVWDSVCPDVITSVHENLREHTYNSDTRNTIFGFISNCVGGLNNDWRNV
jgi:hypothetical protein